MTIPDHVLDKLIADGTIAPDGTSRAAKPRRCRCGARTLVGDDDPRCALIATVDPAPLNRLGEVLALLDGRRTYTLANEGRLVLNPRDAYWINHRPAAGDWNDVLASHRCGAPIPEAWHTRSAYDRPVAVATACPF